jgi:hypothetical protein
MAQTRGVLAWAALFATAPACLASCQASRHRSNPAGPRVLPHERAAALASAAPSRRNNLPMVPLTTASKTSDDFESQISQSGEVNVVYKRSAGGYGVLIPEAK